MRIFPRLEPYSPIKRHLCSNIQSIRFLTEMDGILKKEYPNMKLFGLVILEMAVSHINMLKPADMDSKQIRQSV